MFRAVEEQEDRERLLRFEQSSHQTTRDDTWSMWRNAILARLTTMKMACGWMVSRRVQDRSDSIQGVVEGVYRSLFCEGRPPIIEVRLVARVSSRESNSQPMETSQTIEFLASVANYARVLLNVPIKKMVDANLLMSIEELRSVATEVK